MSPHVDPMKSIMTLDVNTFCCILMYVWIPRISWALFDLVALWYLQSKGENGLITTVVHKWCIVLAAQIYLSWRFLKK